MEYEGRFSTLSWIMLVPVIPAVVMVWLTGLDAPQTLALPLWLLPPFARSAALLRTILKCYLMISRVGQPFSLMVVISVTKC